MGLAPGDMIERYQVEHLLGEGGMASVWAVRHTVLGRRLALKILHQTSAEHQERILREGRAQASIQRPAPPCGPQRGRSH